VPMAEVFRRHPGELLAGIFAVIACFAIFYLSTSFALGYGVGTLHYDRERFLGVQLAAMLCMAGSIIAAGYAADASSPRRVLMGGCVATVAVGLAMGPVMGGGSLLLVWVWLSLALTAMGFVYGPLAAYLPSLFPPRVRYSGGALAFSLGGIVGGGLTPFAAQALADKYGLAPVGACLAGAALLSLAGLAAVRPRHED
jgi:MFS family permease